IARRRWPRPMPASASIQQPESSGPRCAIGRVMRVTDCLLTAPVARMPAIPHMISARRLTFDPPGGSTFPEATYTSQKRKPIRVMIEDRAAVRKIERVRTVHAVAAKPTRWLLGIRFAVDPQDSEEAQPVAIR